MRVLKVTILALAALLAGTAFTSSQTSKRQIAGTNGASLDAPIPQCSLRVCPPPQQQGQ